MLLNETSSINGIKLNNQHKNNGRSNWNEKTFLI
jgi:hypothetical protein